MGTIIYSPNRFSKTNWWSNICGFQKITRFPFFSFRHFLSKSFSDGVFQNLKYAHKIPVLMYQMGILKMFYMTI